MTVEPLRLCNKPSIRGQTGLTIIINFIASGNNVCRYALNMRAAAIHTCCSICPGACDWRQSNAKSITSQKPQSRFSGRNPFHRSVTQRLADLFRDAVSLSSTTSPRISLLLALSGETAYQFESHQLRECYLAHAGIGPIHSRLYFCPTIRRTPARHQPNR